MLPAALTVPGSHTLRGSTALALRVWTQPLLPISLAKPAATSAIVAMRVTWMLVCQHVKGPCFVGTKGLKPCVGGCLLCLQSWRSDKLRHLPEMRFVYEEEAAPEEFFVPYCWSLAVTATGNRLMNWNLGAVALLTQLSGVDVSIDGGLEQRWSEDAYHSGELNV